MMKNTNLSNSILVNVQLIAAQNVDIFAIWALILALASDCYFILTGYYTQSDTKEQQVLALYTLIPSYD